MNYTLEKISFPSADGENTVYGEIYMPKTEKIKGILQLCHGMVDYVGRYGLLAEYITGEGYILAGHCHLGHGATAACPEDLGFFAKKDGIELLLSDVKGMRELLGKRFPTLKVILMGHSMGSFISRLYAAKYPETLDGHIIHGTSGPMGAILPMGKALVKTIMLFRGKRYRSPFVAGLAFAGYNKYFEKGNPNAWLTRDLPLVSDRGDDPYTSFIFTLSAYHDLFTMLENISKRSWYDSYPKELPTLIMSGTMDPVGQYGEGPRRVFDGLSSRGAAVDIRMYEDARHELFNELCREEVFRDIRDFLERLI